MAMEFNWSDLPDDLLHLVYARVVGLLQRVRFAAVCTSWRDAAATVSRHTLPPAIPCHISSFGGNRDRIKRMYCPEDSEVFAIRVPTISVVRRFLGAHDGGWVAALTRKHVKLVVVNLFSGVEVPLSVKQRKFVPSRHGPCTIQKIVFSQEPTSSDCILAALTNYSQVALCRVSCLDDEGWIRTQCQSRFTDIAFCNGKLYGINANTELDRLDITNKDGATLSVVVTRLLSDPSADNNIHPLELDLHNSTYRNHLFDMGGKLAMATSWWPCRYNTMPLFNVFKLTHGGKGNRRPIKWIEVTSLGENALFLGERCSKAVRVPVGRRIGVERNCIYSANALYFGNGGRLHHEQQNERSDEGVRMIEVAHVSKHGMWLIPPNV